MIPRSFHAIVAGTLMLLLAACSSTSLAPVVERTPTSSSLPPAPTGPGYHTVKRGETLYSIALQYGQDYREIAALNNLQDPSLIKVGQVLRVLPPDTGVRTAPVNIGSVEQRPLDSASPTSTVPATGTPVPVKTGPVGEKRPYSDTALAELSAPDSGQGAATVPEVVQQPVAPSAPASDSSSLGWIWPASGKVIENYHPERNKGIDIAGRSGEPVMAAADGKVMHVGSGLRGYGNLVIVMHGNDYLSAYAHNRKILVKVNEPVKKGQKIAEMGDSDADRVKLHFEIRHAGKPLDPLKFLPTP